jgi:ABC-2 type transport system ATP-binding protein
MKVHDQLVHFSRLSGLSKTQAGNAVDHWLSTLGLSDRGGSKLEDLSHGNQQRVQLAAALAPNPELLILDEPFAGLDPIGVESLAGTLRGLATDGVTIVFSSHQLDLVEDVCEDVAIINEGRVVLSGPLDAIKNESSKRRLTIDVDGEPWVPRAAGTTVIDGQGRSHSIVDGDAPIADLLAEANAAGTVSRFMFEPPRLTDLFREAVGS